ncbi:MAG: 2-polyprenylphenol 6-hydroxylase, partial [Rickettsiales bacterium]|nr:2-polyprenylphenol 6-hydroxylase [Rickettsiales bacterium]
IAKEYGPTVHDIFKEIDYKACASASIAQVHKGVLNANNRKVAIKILRPNIAKTVSRDIRTLNVLIFFVRIFSKFFSKTLSDLSSLLKSVANFELDLLLEAANASKIKSDLKAVEGIYVPEVFWKYSSSNILVLEWLDGIAFSNPKEIANTKFDKKEIAKNLVVAYFHQVYVSGFFHGDMHPGNLILLENGDIGLIDFGIVGKINKKTRNCIAEILIAYLQRDYDQVAKLHIRGDLVPQDTNVDDLALTCRKIGETIVGSNVKEVSAAKLLTSLILMTKEYNMSTRPDLLLLQKTALLVEGVGVVLDPELNMWDLARPWVTKWAKTNIGFDAKIRDFIIDCMDYLKHYHSKR